MYSTAMNVSSTPVAFYVAWSVVAALTTLLTIISLRTFRRQWKPTDQPGTSDGQRYFTASRGFIVTAMYLFLPQVQYPADEILGGLTRLPMWFSLLFAAITTLHIMGFVASLFFTANILLHRDRKVEATAPMTPEEWLNSDAEWPTDATLRSVPNRQD